MTNPAPEELIPFLAHKDRLVRSYGVIVLLIYDSVMS